MSEVGLIAYLMDHAFAGSEFHSLMANLATVERSMWQSPLPGSRRTIGEIVMHVGSSKVMYCDYAFGTGALSWEHPTVEPWPPRQAPMGEAIEWLRVTHANVMAHVATLTDEDLLKPRLANWGEAKETRWLLSTLMQHDLYHSGEINRIRSMHSGEDRWQWQIELGVDS